MLPVLACREIAMSSNGKIGHVLRSQDKPLAKAVQQAYDEVAKRWNIPELLPKLMSLAPVWSP